MRNIRNALEPYLLIFPFGTDPKTGLFDMACRENDTIARGLTEAQISDIGDWLDLVLDKITEWNEE